MEATRDEGKKQGRQWEGQGAGGGEDRCLKRGERTGEAGREWRDCV